MEHHHNPTPVHHHQQQLSQSEVQPSSKVSKGSTSNTFLSPSSAASALKRPLENPEQERHWKRQRRHSVMDEMSLNSSSKTTTGPANSNTHESATSTTPTEPSSATPSTFDKNTNQQTVPTPKARQRALSEPNHPTIMKSKQMSESQIKRQQTILNCKKVSSSQKSSRRGSHDRPPVNLVTLRELDLKEILNNPRLRHDIYFDAALHFRPNLDGQRGQKKRAQADQYWDAIAKECETVRRNQHSLQRGSSTRLQPKKLIILFETMRDILLSLVPARDQKTVEQVFDQSLLMQQLEYGLLDFKRLAEWLAQLLKAHCAPMRDSWVDDMVSKIVDGVDTENTRLLVDGLRSVFGILEAMKLDVANHQIRTLRPFLVSSAAEFEREHFQKRVSKSQLDIEEPQQWYQRVVLKYTAIAERCDYQGCLTQGIMDILTPSRSELTPVKPPATFTFDMERLEAIKFDIREDTCMKICLLLFRQLVFTTKCKRDIDEETTNELTTILQAILGEEDTSERWEKQSSAVALQLAQFATAFAQGKDSVNKAIPEANMVSMAETWLATHIKLNSKIYKMVESKIVLSITERTETILKAWSIHKTPTLQNLSPSVMGLSAEFAGIPQRLAKILNLHWRIFETMYLSPAQLQQLQLLQGQKPGADKDVVSAAAATAATSAINNELIHGVSDISLQHVERKEPI